MKPTPKKPLASPVLCRGPTASLAPKYNEWEERSYGNGQL